MINIEPPKKIKKYLKKFKILVLIKRIIFKSFNFDGYSHINESYFRRRIKKISPSNLTSLSFEDGLLLPDGKNYLIKIKPGSLIETTIFTKGAWEEHIQNLIKLYLGKENQIMIDVGANVGSISIPLAKEFQMNHFYLFEPHPDIFKTLNSNIRINKLNNIHPKQFAISHSQKKTINFYAQKNSTNMGLSSIKLNKYIKNFSLIKVKTTKLDDFFAQIKKNIAIIKIDTQGSESIVLESARNLIKKNRPIIIFEYEDNNFETINERIAEKEKLNHFFKLMGYGLYSIIENEKFLTKIAKLIDYNGDILAIPES